MKRWVIVVIAMALAIIFAVRAWWSRDVVPLSMRDAPSSAQSTFLHWHLAPVAGNRIDNYRIQLASFDAHGLTGAWPIPLDVNYLPAKGIIFNRSNSFGYTVLRTRALRGPLTIVRIEPSGRVTAEADLPTQEVDEILSGRGMKYRLRNVKWETQAVAVDWERSRLFTVGCIGGGESIFAVLFLKEKKWQVADRWDEKYCLDALLYEPSANELFALGSDFRENELGKGRKVFRLSTEGKVLNRLPSNIDALLSERQNRVAPPLKIEQNHERYGQIDGKLVLMYDEVEFSYDDPNHYELTRLTIDLDWDTGTAVVAAR
jgi:hypothetical protein